MGEEKGQLSEGWPSDRGELEEFDVRVACGGFSKFRGDEALIDDDPLHLKRNQTSFPSYSVSIAPRSNDLLLAKGQVPLFHLEAFVVGTSSNHRCRSCTMRISIVGVDRTWLSAN